MKTINRALRHGLTALIVSGIFLLVSVTPQAQTTAQLASPNGHVNDFAGVLDAKTKDHLESLLESLKQRSTIVFYIAIVTSTGNQDIFDFSRQLARDWDVGARTSAAKSFLLVVSVGEKTSFTQFSKSVQSDLPEGALGELSQRMRTALGLGEFAQVISLGVQHFVNTLAEKLGFSMQDTDKSAAGTTASSPAESKPLEPAPQTVPVALSVSEKTRPRLATENPKTPLSTIRKTSSPVDDEAEAEEVELTLTLPVSDRVVKLKTFLATHPKSKARSRATELLISAHAALGDQMLKNGDSAGGVDQLMLAIEEADTSISDKLFSGVISQIPLNLYLRGEQIAAFKAAQSVETKFGGDPKRLLAIAGFYLGLERGDEAARVATQAVKLAPDMSEAHHALALALHISLRLDEATAEYKRALELDPQSKRTRASLADLNRATGKAEEALALYNEQLTADPKDKAARTGMVMSLLDLGRKEEANTALEAALADDPRNLNLLTAAAYWFAAHGNSEKAYELGRKAVSIEPRYTWAQIAMVHALLGLNRPVEAERAIRFARQYGRFPTLDYELASVLSTLGLYDEAAEVLRGSFQLKEGQIEARLGGGLLAREAGFVELLAPERRASIYQFQPADSSTNATMLKALLSFSVSMNPPTASDKVDENAVVVAAREFASGEDNMRAYRQLYVAGRMIRNNLGLPAALELIEDAKKAVDSAIESPAATIAVQADELREIRARAINSGNTPDLAEAPRNVLSNIMRGRIEDLQGWALFNQDKYPEAIEHLKLAARTLPEGTPSWRGAVWHLGVALEQSGNKEDALTNYIKSYNSGEKDANRRSVIEQLYRKINGSLDGLDDKIGPSVLTSASNIAPVASATTEPTTNKPTTEAVVAPSTESSAPAGVPEKTPTPEPTPEGTSKPETAPAKPSETVETPKPEATPAPTPEATPVPSPEPAPPTASPTPQAPDAQPPADASPFSDSALKAAASRVRSSLKISGQIKDANKNAMANVVVVLISPSGTVMASTTDTDGNYSFTVAPSQRTYRIIPSKDGYTFDPVDKAFPGLSDDQKEINFVGTVNK